jgi:Spy/CpxP family protein refolding chaperone
MLQRSVIIAGVIWVLGSLAGTASAQGPGGGMFGRGGGGSSAMLLGMAEVQKELNLSDEQKKQIEALGQDVREKFRASVGQFNFQELQNLSAEEREKRLGELRKKGEEVAKGVDEKVGKILDAKQVERLHQLQLQRAGAMALSQPDVIKKLGLSEEQQAKIKKIQEDARPKGWGGFDRNQSEADRQAAFKKMREQYEKAQKDCLAVLNDDQMLDWTNMCGKEFKFPERQFRRGNRPGTPPPPQQ